MIVHAVTPADALAVACHRYPNEFDTGEREIYVTWVAGATERGLYLGFVALDVEEVVAGAGLTLLEWGPSRGDSQPWRARVVNVWMPPDWRRRGLGRDLVTRCLQVAGQRGVTRVGLGTSAEARALYEGLGLWADGSDMRLSLCGPGLPVTFSDR